MHVDRCTKALVDPVLPPLPCANTGASARQLSHNARARTATLRQDRPGCAARGAEGYKVHPPQPIRQLAHRAAAQKALPAGVGERLLQHHPCGQAHEGAGRLPLGGEPSRKKLLQDWRICSAGDILCSGMDVSLWPLRACGLLTAQDTPCPPPLAVYGLPSSQTENLATHQRELSDCRCRIAHQSSKPIEI